MTHKLHVTLAFCCIFLLQTVSYATPFWTQEQIDSARAENFSDVMPQNIETGQRARRRALDDIAYFVKYRQLCDFLANMQVTTAGANFGGMREGEVGGDYNIIQTDNTQEAIRVWSQYGIWTGDTAHYAQNIRNAWTYCTVWPAWREEGGGYYAMHNSGWGFEATAKYREAYNDTSMNWYADSCALWVAAHPLSLTGTLNIAAEGLGIGGMYPHAVYRGRTDWQTHTLTQARQIRDWFTAQPSRLNTSTEWALCGGTAIWGVCNSLWIADPDSGAMWINQYGTQLETWESPSNWYNAYNTWYSNATFRFWEITGDSLYWNRGVFYADSLVGFDVDDDGAIPPGTCCISNGNDHSWVSAYMGWMGLERIISSGPIVLAGPQGVVVPDSAHPLLEGDTTPVRVRVANMGTEPLTALIEVFADFQYYDSAYIDLMAGEIADMDMDTLWNLPPKDSLHGVPLGMEISMRYWSPAAEDTTTEFMFISFDLRHQTSVSGLNTGEYDQTGVPCHIDFYSADYPDSIWTSVDVAQGQLYSNGARPLMEGLNRMVITPPARYLVKEVNFVTDPNEPSEIDNWLFSSDVVLVDDDSGEDYESYLLSSLDENNLDVRVWDSQSSEVGDLTHVPWMIWMTGDDAASTLTATDQQALTDYMSDGGGLLLTGQNISDDPDAATFLHDVLYVIPEEEDTDRLRAFGIGDNPDVDGEFLLLLGTQGAGNQSSPSSIIPLGGATAIFINDTTTEGVCGVAGQYGAGKFIFLSFGLEAASGQAGSTSRAVFLSVAEQWLTELTDVAPAAPVASRFELLPSFPNPFNGEVQIRWFAPNSTEKTSIEVYDVLGRRITTLFDGVSNLGDNIVTWNGATSKGVNVSSGTYLVRLTTSEWSKSQAIRYIR